MRRRPPLRLLWSDRRGAIAVLAALSMVMLLGAIAMAMDLSRLYLALAVNQRIADQAAVAAAFAYGQSSSSAAVATRAAASMAVVNGAGAAAVAASVVSSPSGDGRQAVKVVVTSTVSLSPFGQFVTAGTGRSAGILTVPVNATGYAEIQQASPCIIALSANGITATGGIQVTATDCAMGSAGSVTATDGAHITAEAIYAVHTIAAPNNDGSSVTTSPTAGQTFPGSSAPSDPYAGAGVFARMPTVATMAAPAFPAVGAAPSGGSSPGCGSTLTVASGVHAGIASYGSGCGTVTFTGGAETDLSGGLSLNSGSNTINFAAGTYKIYGITLGSDSSVTINISGAVVLDIWGGFNLTGSTALTVNGAATWNIQGGINDYSTGPMVFRNGSGGATSSFTVAGGIVVSYNVGTFPDGTYVITSGFDGIAVGGTGIVTFGDGSFDIADGISVSSGGRLTIGSQANGGVFQIPTPSSDGSAISTGGGSTLTIGSFPDLDINGPVTLSGSVGLGAGVYTVNGAFNACSSGGGSLSGSAVSIIAAGAFCFGQGYDAISVSAPAAITSGTEGSAATIALASSAAGTATITGGAANTVVAGAVYFPSAPLQLSGAGNLNGGGSCLQIIAGSLAFSGGSGASTTCSGLGGTSAGSVALVQ